MALGVSRADRAWTWDPSLYAGSARYYAAGRVAYPDEVAQELVRALPLDGTGVLLDVGCGPGSLTLLLAPYVAQAFGLDPDADMLAEAARQAAVRQVQVTWRRLRGEDLPGDLPRPRLVTFAQSFHWMDRPRVAATVRRMLAPGGAVVHLGATTHQGVDSDEDLPRPPRGAIDELLRKHLGPVRRAGQGVRAQGMAGDENEVFRSVGFAGPERIEVPGRVVARTADQVVASVYSLSYAAPHLFGERLEEFDRELRQLLAGAGEEFRERMGAVVLTIWR